MKLTSKSFKEGDRIPGEFAFAIVSPVDHVALSANRSPHLCWTGAPQGTESFALICKDLDVPSTVEDANKEGRTVAASLPRVDFFHWLLLDIPSTTNEILAGAHSEGVVAHGKSGLAAPGSLRHGVNDYTGWFAGDTDMQGDYFGYDGPCPPWNDSVPHRYVFTVFALDVRVLVVDGVLSGANINAALEGHVLDSASLLGTYSLNPGLKP